METLDNIFLASHIVAGSLSLISFFIPVFTKKGGDIHRKAGKFYVFCMWFVVGTAAALSVLNVIAGTYIAAGFLGFLTFITAFPLWYAIVILNYKRAIPDRVLLARQVLNLITFFGGIGLIAWSIAFQLEGQTILLLIFGILGLTTGFTAFESKTKARENANWLREHVSGMIVTGIAAYTAFFAFGGSTFFGELLSGKLVFIPWVLPGILGSLTIRYYTKKLRLRGQSF